MSREYDQIKGLIKNAEECLSTAYKRGYKDGKNSVDPKTKMADFIKIPEGATNGDMIKAMFPNVDKYKCTLLENHNKNVLFGEEWWDSPYRKEN